MILVRDFQLLKLQVFHTPECLCEVKLNSVSFKLQQGKKNLQGSSLLHDYNRGLKVKQFSSSRKLYCAKTKSHLDFH